MTGIQGISPKVTVAIPVYNSATTLIRCINSATSQTMRDIEIIVVDDCSTDQSATVAETLALEDRRIRVIRLSQNRGKPAVMNTITAAARGEWIAVLDADDAFRPDRLERLVSAAEARGVEMVADNLFYIDAGVGRVIRTAFRSTNPPRVLTMPDFVAAASVYAEFDFGILKPIVRRSFIEASGISYYEQTRLAEDFYYLLSFFAAGGRALLLSTPLYEWTLPFGTVSRQWTGTGAGAWRYDYRPALRANEHFIADMRARGRMDVVAMLTTRSREYRAMMFYLDAQRFASEGQWMRCFREILLHPVSYRLLASRLAGRGRRAVHGAFNKPTQHRTEQLL